MASRLQHRRDGLSLRSDRESAFLLLVGKSSIGMACVCLVWESGIILWKVTGVCGCGCWRFNGFYQSETLRVMACSVVLGLVLRLRVQNHRWRLDFCHLILLCVKIEEIIKSYERYNILFHGSVKLTRSLKKGLYSPS